MPLNDDQILNNPDNKQDFPILTDNVHHNLNYKSYLELGFSHSEPVHRFGVA